MTRRAKTVAVASACMFPFTMSAPRSAQANLVDDASTLVMVDIVTIAVVRLLGSTVGNRFDVIVAQVDQTLLPDGSTRFFVGALPGQTLRGTPIDFGGTGIASNFAFVSGTGSFGSEVVVFGLTDVQRGSLSFSFFAQTLGGAAVLNVADVSLETELGVPNVYTGVFSRSGLPDETIEFEQTFSNLAEGSLAMQVSFEFGQPVEITAARRTGTNLIDVGVTVVPEPSTALLIGLGALGLLGSTRRIC